MGQVYLGELTVEEPWDLWSDTLAYVDRLYDRAFGNQTRKECPPLSNAISHVPHMIDWRIMRDFEARWPEEFERTSSHNFRAGDDMQYSMAYFYFMMHQEPRVLAESFRLDHMELRRAFMTAFLLDLGHEAYYEFLTQLHRCANATTATNTTLERVEGVKREEEYFRRNPIRLGTLLACTRNEGSQVNRHWWLARRGVNRFEVADVGLLVFQARVTPDPERVRAQLFDQVLNALADSPHPYKFGCINNDIVDPTTPEAIETFKVVRRFYEILFPDRSSFELPEGQANNPHPHLSDAHH